LIILVIAIGTIFYWLALNTSPRFQVPFEYYPNKIIFGSLWGFITFKVLRNYAKIKSSVHLALLMSLIVAAILQTKYFFRAMIYTLCFYLWGFTL